MNALALPACPAERLTDWAERNIYQPLAARLANDNGRKSTPLMLVVILAEPFHGLSKRALWVFSF